MTEKAPTPLRIEQIDPTARWTAALLRELTAELASGGYAPEETFGYDAEQLLERGVRLLGAFTERELVAMGGVEIDGEDAELKRFYVRPEHRGSGAAQQILDALVAEAERSGVRRLRLETGIHQHAALRFYRRNGFVDIPRFGPYVDSETSLCLERVLAPAT